MMRTIALTLTLLLASTALADDPVDGGAPPADAAPPPADAAPPAPTPTPAPTSAAPYSLLSETPRQPDVPARARPTPLYKSTLFWCAVVLGAGAVAAISVGAAMAASFHPRYALVTF
ncbi:MAG: hypothetical protein ACXVCV_16780 [Polyangia bacterium]